MKRPIEILIVDDSAVVRQIYRSLLECETDLKVVAVANDPFEAVRRIAESVPDVMIVDVEMPRMDGVTFLRKVMSQHPIPAVVCSTLTALGSGTAFEAMRAGAVEVLEKPRDFAQDGDFATRLRRSVRVAAIAKLHKPQERAVSRLQTGTQGAPGTRDARDAGRTALSPHLAQTGDALHRPTVARTRPTLIAIGASTGGTEAIRRILAPLPANMPPIAIVQHMPEGFTASFASWLDSCCQLKVSEAVDGQVIAAGCVVIARGGRHLRVVNRHGSVVACLGTDEAVRRHRPSVDALFDSVTGEFGSSAEGIILTGMGDDGAEGLLHLRNSGATTVAESEETAVVFGMPKEAIARGGAELVLGLGEIARHLDSLSRQEVL